MHQIEPPYPAEPAAVPHGVPLTEAATLLGMNRETLRQQVRRGKVPAYKVDGHWYVDLSAIPSVAGSLSGTLPGAMNGSVNGALASASAPLSTDNAVESVLITQLHSENQVLRDDVAFLREELRRKDELLRAEQDTRRREVQELHVLLQRAQAQIPMPATAARQPDDSDEQLSAREPRRRRWWWPFGAVP